MKVAFVEELPRILIVCTRDIQVGKEFVLRYSDEHGEAHLGNSLES